MKNSEYINHAKNKLLDLFINIEEISIFEEEFLYVEFYNQFSELDVAFTKIPDFENTKTKDIISWFEDFKKEISSKIRTYHMVGRA